MKRPIVFILLFLCLGIFSNFYFNDITIIIFTIGLFAFNTLLFLRHKSKYVYLFFIFYILGMLLTIDIASVQTNQQYEITGVIKDIDTNNYTSNVLVSVENINSNKEDFNILLITKDFSLEIGDKIQFTSTLQDFQKYEYIYNKSKNIDYKTYCDDILVIGQSKNFNYYSNKIVTLFSSIYDQVFFEEEANIVKALILGTKDDISTYTKDLYTKGGIIHILSLSGLHITILATALFFILSTFIRSNLKNILIILFLIFYLFLTGNVISTRRAVLMSTCVLMAPILKREYDLPSSICFSAIIILLTNPYSLFNISFILSYSAVIGLVLLTPKIEMCYNSLSIKSNNKILLKFNNLIKYLAPFIAVFISLQPILAYNFYYIYPYSIIVNALLSIFIAPLIILSFICGIVGLVSIPLATFIGASVYYILILFEIVCTMFSNLPFSSVLVGKPNIILIILYYLIIYSLFFKKSNKLKLFSITTITTMFILILLNKTISIDTLYNYGDIVAINNTETTFLDGETKKSYYIDDYVHSYSNKSASTIITDSIDISNYLYKNNMLSTAYIVEDNQLIISLNEKDIPYTKVKNGEPIIIDNITYYISGNNIYADTNSISYSNIKDFSNIYPSNIQNNIHENDYYDIIINNAGKTSTISNDNNTKITIINNKFIIGEK